MKNIIRPQYLKTAKGKATAEALAERIPENTVLRIASETEDSLIFRILKGEKGSAPSKHVPEGATVTPSGLLSIPLEEKKPALKKETAKKKGGTKKEKD